MPAVAPLHPWLWPAKPWQRIHIDYAGPVEGKMMLVVVDAHSKWPEVISMTSSTSQATIRALRGLFASYGLPQQLVSDNGPQFTSDEFTVFLKRNGVKHLLSSPYHPSTNGLAERFVRTLKSAMKNSDIKDPHQRLMDFLLSYHTTPHSTTGSPPCELFMQRISERDSTCSDLKWMMSFFENSRNRKTTVTLPPTNACSSWDKESWCAT